MSLEWEQTPLQLPPFTGGECGFPLSVGESAASLCQWGRARLPSVSGGRARLPSASGRRARLPSVSGGERGFPLPAGGLRGVNLS